MRGRLAAFLACLFVVVITADVLACSDGCTDEMSSTQLSAHHGASPCLLCLGWNRSPVVVAFVAAPRVIERRPLAVVRPTSLPLPVVERPPRPA